jgi:hypothetical protein
MGRKQYRFVEDMTGKGKQEHDESKRETRV